MTPADVIVLEGILVLHMEHLRSLLNMKVYVDTDDDVRLARRCAGIGGSSGLLGDSRWGLLPVPAHTHHTTGLAPFCLPASAGYSATWRCGGATWGA